MQTATELEVVWGVCSAYMCSKSKVLVATVAHATFALDVVKLL